MLSPRRSQENLARNARKAFEAARNGAEDKYRKFDLPPSERQKVATLTEWLEVDVTRLSNATDAKPKLILAYELLMQPSESLRSISQRYKFVPDASKRLSIPVDGTPTAEKIDASHMS